MRAPRAKLMLGVWCAPDEATVEALGRAAGADCAFRSFREAALAALEEAAGDGWRPPAAASPAAATNPA